MKNMLYTISPGEKGEEIFSCCDIELSIALHIQHVYQLYRVWDIHYIL